MSTDWIQAIIIPILKPNKERPIIIILVHSTYSHPGQNIKTNDCKRLNCYLKSKCLTTEEQAGCGQNKNIVHQTLRFTQAVKEAINQKGVLPMIQCVGNFLKKLKQMKVKGNIETTTIGYRQTKSK